MSKYELVCGLEIHVELATQSKIFCGCSTKFGSLPNTQCCPICLGMPGTLPQFNEKVVDYAVLAGLATNCNINRISKMDRKNYFYPDLPKAYQITQNDCPICSDGFLDLNSGKRIKIKKIHIEEDAAKLIYKDNVTLIDYNRSGMPLIEIVTEPDINSSEEAREFIEKIKMLMSYLEISDCKMQEGSIRCDVNISIKNKETGEISKHIEIKNVNSISFIAQAIEYEFKKQIEQLESGQEIEHTTKRYSEAKEQTQVIRGKEHGSDYRYFRDPDLTKIVISQEKIDQLKESLPEFADVKIKRYIKDFSLSNEEAKLLSEYKKIAVYFEEAAKDISNKKLVANFIIEYLFKGFKTREEKEKFNIQVSCQSLNKLAKLLEGEKINKLIARVVFQEMMQTGKSLDEIISQKDITNLSLSDLQKLCEQVIKENQKAVQDYRAGKEKALQIVISQVIKRSQNRADVNLIKNELTKIINN